MAQLDTTLDDEIAQFFSSSGTSATRRDCDSFALGVFGGPIEPVAIQGATSYTIVAGLDREKIVQFRMKDAQVDMGMLSMARQVHGDIVPGGRVLGSIGDEAASQLVVYEMNKLPGLNYAVVRAFLVEYPTRQMATIHSLARFFAQAWQGALPADQVALAAIAADLSGRLDDVASSGVLTARLEPALEKVRKHLPALVSESFPLALTHSDLNELNILVDGESGSITGVVDWADAAVQPFGLTLYVLEKFIGSIGPCGWVYFDNASALVSKFWGVFAETTGVSSSQMEHIRVARIAGYLLRYGTSYRSGQKGVVGIQEMSIERRRQYLEAILQHREATRT